MKCCSKCKTVQPVSAFTKDAACADGLRPSCKSCLAAYRAVTAEARSAYARAARLKDPQKFAACKASYRQRNAEKVSVARKAQHYANHQHELERNRAWKRANKSKVIAAIARRTAAKLSATPSWAERNKIDEFYFAADFLGMVTGDWYHVDHMIPLQSKQVCGLHCEANLQVIPGSLNQSKSNRYWPDMP